MPMPGDKYQSVDQAVLKYIRHKHRPVWEAARRCVEQELGMRFDDIKADLEKEETWRKARIYLISWLALVEVEGSDSVL